MPGSYDRTLLCPKGQRFAYLISVDANEITYMTFPNFFANEDEVSSMHLQMLYEWHST